MIPLDPARADRDDAVGDFQMAFVGPMFGQVGFFNKFAGKDYEDKRPLARYVNESKRILGVMDDRLPAGNGSWARTTPSPTFRCSAGCVT